MRLLLGRPEACPYCRCSDLRESRLPLAAWERLLGLRRHRCRGCWRRLFVLRLFRAARPGGARIYNRG